MQNASRPAFSVPVPAICAVILAAVLPSGMALALEPDPNEEKVVKACERQLCTMVLGRTEAGPDLKCDLAKTWDRDTLKKGESSSVSWGFGDARCEVDLALSRADIVAALTRPKYEIQIPEHEVKCLVEQDGKPKPVVARLAPKLVFKNGKADKIWINLAEVKGPTAVKATVNMAASLEDTLGIFHRGMVKSVNKFLHRRCGERYYADGRPKDVPDKGKKAADKAGAVQPAKAAATGAKQKASVSADAQ
jgi:hypothetical protein